MEESRIKVVRPLPGPISLPDHAPHPERGIRARFLRPEPGRWFLPRPRLHHLLDAGTAGRLTAVVAAAGYGKTSLVSEWVAGRDRESGWITLDARSNDLQTFGIDLIETIHRIAPHSGRSALLLAMSGPSPSPAHLAAAIADDLAELDEPALIVLDEFQEVEAAPVQAFMSDLLHRPGMNLHLIVCSRQQPPFSLARLLTHGHYLEIDATVLSFTREEVAAYLALVLGSTPDASLVESWWRQSEGWIALIQLAAVNLITRGGQTATGLSLNQARESVAEFLSRDLLDSLPETLRLFALITSVPTSVSADLAGVLVAGRLHNLDSGQVLEDIVRRGMFLSRLDNDGAWYRYHPLFRQVLQAQLLERYGQGQVNVLHLAAATWFAREQRVDRALEHLLIAGNHSGAVALVTQHAQDALCHDRWMEVDRWLRQFPPGLVESSIDLVLAQAMTVQARGMFGLLPDLRDLATRLLSQDATRNRPDRAVLQAEIDVLKVFTPQAEGGDDEDVAGLLATTYQRLKETGRYSELVALQMYAIAAGRRDPEGTQREIDAYLDQARRGATPMDAMRQMWGASAQVIVSRHTGSIDLYGARAARLLRQADLLGSRRLATQAHFFLGAAAYERNDLDQAVDHLQRLVREPAAGIMYLFNGGILLASVLDLMGDLEKSQAMIDDLTERVRDPAMAGYLPMMRQLAVQLALRRGVIPANMVAIHHATLAQTNWPIRVSQSFPLLFLAPLLEAGTDAQLARAREIATSVLEQGRRDHLPGVQLGCEMVLAWLDSRSGNEQAAHDRLDATLARAASMGRVRTIIDAGRFVRPLLEWHALAGHGSEFVDLLIEAIEHDEAMLARSAAAAQQRDQLRTDQPANPIEILTNRELDVLLGLQRRLSNKEIADELSISHMTVKTHTRSIYAKLEVSGRRAAIARAMDLGIIER